MIHERENGIPASDVFGANYPADYPNAALRGNANPLAGQPNLTRVISRYARIWQSMAKTGQIHFNKPKDEDRANFISGKGKGKGGKGSFGKGKGGKGGWSFYGGRGTGNYDGGNTSSGKIRTEKDLCLKCGGLGHYAHECGTKCEISKAILDGISYPHIEDRGTQRTKYLAKRQAQANSVQNDEGDHSEGEEEISLCEDGVDNDLDGLSDLLDPGCSAPRSDEENECITGSFYRDHVAELSGGPGGPQVAAGLRAVVDHIKANYRVREPETREGVFR